MSNLHVPQALDKKVLVAPDSVDLVHIVALRHPFRTHRVLAELIPGSSIADMMRTLGIEPTIPARVFLGDRIVMPDERECVYPELGQTLTLRVVPAGGGRGKDVELLTIAIAAVATAATAGLGAALAAPAAAGTAGASAAAGASTTVFGIPVAGLAAITPHVLVVGALQGALGESIKFLGGLAINSLIPSPRTPVAKQETTPHSYTVAGTANAAAPFSPIPKIYGTRRIFPQYAASPYSELSGFNQYLRMLFLLGYGPLDISQIKIGDTAIEDYEDVEWELRAGFPDDAPTRLYPGSVSEADFNIQLSKTNGGGVALTVYDWTQVPVQTSGTNADELFI